jgi:hypothetical protein
MPDKLDNQDDERLDFWRGWKGLYIFLFVYGVAQIVLLYIFTEVLNRP